MIAAAIYAARLPHSQNKLSMAPWLGRYKRRAFFVDGSNGKPGTCHYSVFSGLSERR